jgi:hypothetical protein
MWKYRLQKERRVSPRRPVITGDRAYVVFFYDKGSFSESALLAFDRAFERSIRPAATDRLA